MELLFVAKVMMYSNFLMEAKMQLPFVTDVMLFLHFVSVTIWRLKVSRANVQEN